MAPKSIVQGLIASPAHLLGHCRNCSVMHNGRERSCALRTIPLPPSKPVFPMLVSVELRTGNCKTMILVAATRLVLAKLAWADFLIVTMQSDVMLKREAKGENQSMPTPPCSVIYLDSLL